MRNDIRNKKEKTPMIRKTIFALATIATVGAAALVPTTASAHGKGWYGGHFGIYIGYPHSHCFWKYLQELRRVVQGLLLLRSVPPDGTTRPRRARPGLSSQITEAQPASSAAPSGGHRPSPAL